VARKIGRDGNDFGLSALEGSYKADQDYANKTGLEIIITNMQNGRTIKLPAFLTSLDQSFDSSWNTEEVFGRMDSIATYQGTKRSVTFGVNVVSRNFKDTSQNHAKVSTLTKMVYPSYNTEGIMSKAPLVSVKFGSLICNQNGDGLLGYFTSFKFNYNLEMGYFIQNKVSLPKVISLDFSLSVLHTEELGYEPLIDAKTKEVKKTKAGVIKDGWRGGTSSTRFPFGRLK
jgi:hypothetical protein